MRQIVISENEAGQRLDRVLFKYLDRAPQSFCYRMLRKKNICLNGKKAEGQMRLAVGDVIELFLSEETIHAFTGAHVPVCTQDDLQILYENRHVMLLDKPCGVLSQRAKPDDVSMVELLTAHLLRTGEVTKEGLKTFRPSVCSRLDRNTSGILAAGKTLYGLQTLSELIRTRRIRKFYLCIVEGSMETEQEFSGWLEKDERTNRVTVRETEGGNARPVCTRCRPLSQNGRETLLEVELLTGRTHQIRAQLSAAGYPLLGDAKYGDPVRNREAALHTQLLHAFRLEMPALYGELADLSEHSYVAPVPPLFEQTAAGRGLGTWQHGIPEA